MSFLHGCEYQSLQHGNGTVWTNPGKIVCSYGKVEKEKINKIIPHASITNLAKYLVNLTIYIC